MAQLQATGVTGSLAISGSVGVGTSSPLGLLHATPESVTGTRVDGLRLSKQITNAANYSYYCLPYPRVDLEEVRKR
jgi:hypothetical protein